MTVSRRSAIKSLGAAATVPIFGLKPEATGLVESARGFRLQAEELESVLPAIADVVLPSDCDRKAAVAAFTRWIDNYKEGADTDHGYGTTRVRATGPSPAARYPAQVVALDAAARAQGASTFSAATVEQRRAILEAAIAEAKVQRFSARPTGAHIATDLMGHYFNSSPAADLCYRASIGRDVCRGLPGSENAPPPLPLKGGSDRPGGGSDRPGGGSHKRPDARSARVSAANEPRERREPAKRRASERVGESEGRSPSVQNERREPAKRRAGERVGESEGRSPSVNRN
ncbi:MAG TPA: gluconate 2-dehydrogenase subunit 3 family protein [Vicinamibacterales bacterium]|nr:gluconate 2-dehydrogenase subunit 3 family protein [Vicinamibacterales bacterium]